MARIRLDGDSTGLVQAQRKAKESAEDLNKTFKETERITNRLEKQVKKAWADARQPLERYNAKLEDLKTLLKENRISQDQYNFAVRELQGELRGTERSMLRTFGRQQLSRMTAAVAGLASVQGAVNLVTQAFRELQEERRKLAEDLREGLVPGIAQLTQLAGGDQARFDRLRQSVRESRQLGLDERDAAGLIFQLQSADILSRRNVELLSRARVAGVIDQPGELAGAAATFQANLGGTFVETISGALAASGFTKANLDQLVNATSVSAQTARAVGLSRAEVFAGTAVAAQTARTADIGATQFRSFLSAAEKAGLRGGLGDVTNQLQQRVARGETLRDILGDRVEALTFARVAIDRQGEITRVTDAVTEGIRTNQFLQNIQFAERQPDIALRIRSLREQENREIERANEARQQLRVDLETERQLDAARGRGAGPLQQFFTRRALEGASLLGIEAEGLGDIRGALDVGIPGIEAADAGARAVVNAVRNVSATIRETAGQPTQENPEN